MTGSDIALNRKGRTSNLLKILYKSTTLVDLDKGPVGEAIFVASYLLLIFRVEQLVTSTI